MKAITRGVWRRFSTASPIRDPGYGRLGDREVQAFERLLGPGGVIADSSDLRGYNTDWFGTSEGHSRVVLRPKTVEEVSGILKMCSRERLAVCPQGGNTGLVAGSVPVFDEIILSTSLMNKIINVDPLAGTVTCEAGCVLEAVNSRLEEDDLMMPYDLGSKGSCQIGGNISTCAGGLRLIRYGSLQANLLGIQAVLANGEVLDCMNAHRKDNTGYHLRQLFVGAEGTLGIVTKAVINCPIRPKSVSLAFLAVDSYEDVLKTLVKARQRLGESLAACEMLDDVCMQAVQQKLGLRSPLGPNTETRFYMLVESHASNPEHDSENVHRFLEDCLSSGLVKDGTMSQEPSKMKEIWKIRERCVEALARDNHLYTYDMTFGLKDCYRAVEETRKFMKASGYSFVSVSGFGHIGDGNVHLNVVAEIFDPLLNLELESFVYDWTAGAGGSMSSEHGIGLKKIKHLERAKGRRPIQVMRAIKSTMDPSGILNPYKVLPQLD